MGGGKAAGAVGPVRLLTSWREPAATGDTRRPAQYLASSPLSAHTASTNLQQMYVRTHTHAHTVKLVSLDS